MSRSSRRNTRERRLSSRRLHWERMGGESSALKPHKWKKPGSIKNKG